MAAWCAPTWCTSGVMATDPLEEVCWLQASLRETRRRLESRLLRLGLEAPRARCRQSGWGRKGPCSVSCPLGRPRLRLDSSWGQALRGRPAPFFIWSRYGSKQKHSIYPTSFSINGTFRLKNTACRIHAMACWMTRSGFYWIVRIGYL